MGSEWSCALSNVPSMSGVASSITGPSFCARRRRLRTTKKPMMTATTSRPTTPPATGPATHAELFSGLPTSVEEDVGLAEDVWGVDVAKYFGFGTMVVYVVVKDDTTPPGRVVGTSVVTVVPMMKSVAGAVYPFNDATLPREDHMDSRAAVLVGVGTELKDEVPSTPRAQMSMYVAKRGLMTSLFKAAALEPPYTSAHEMQNLKSFWYSVPSSQSVATVARPASV